MVRTLLVVASIALAVACDAPSTPPAQPDASPTAAGPTAMSSAPAPSPSGTRTPSTATSPTPDPDPILYAVGDIASCSADDDSRVAALLRGQRGQIALLGDAVYDSGTPAEYRDCFDPAWGPMRPRLRPAAGNHDYRTSGAAGYFGYFGELAGEPGEGWYAFNMGPHWRVISLNSECAEVGGCTADSPQGQWLAETLAAAGDRHIIAFWHTPLFSTARHGPVPEVMPFWEALYQAGADIVLVGHDHVYERFAPQTPAGEPDPRGIRQFTVGTGGFTLYEFPSPPLPTTEVRNNTSFGVLRLRLEPDGYRWRFIPATGSFTDAGRQRL